MQHICAVDDIPVGEGLRVTSVSPPIAVFLTEDGAVHAIDDTCTHQDASLADGWVEDCWVECPLHAPASTWPPGTSTSRPPRGGSGCTG
jgi:3-phenylpropionate/trans-cinnamate dioxygenase ferredoxin subunit